MRILITAGPTREYIDPVRYISNRSSGKMGYAIAVAALERGHEVVLISGPVSIPAPAGAQRISVVSAADMLAAVESQLEACDALVMAAAVCDWRPTAVADKKLKKLQTGGGLELEPTADILMTIKSRKGTRVVVGFAAETNDVQSEAQRKLAAKGLDMVVANDVTQPDAGFDVDTNRVTFLTPVADPVVLPLLSKPEVGRRIVEWVETKAGVSSRSLKSSDMVWWRGIEDRLARQMNFIREIDKLKTVSRRTLLMNGARFENDAEHSWHLAVMAMLLKEYADDPGLDLLKVFKMVLIHDLVEIDAGDTYCYDEKGNEGKVAREKVAAARLFGMLPIDQQSEFHSLWTEFEERTTSEARFAAALDRVQPLLHNYSTGGLIWHNHGITSDKVQTRNRHVAEGSRALWGFAEGLIRDAVEKGYLKA
jgi:putative hydrolase of HD superfamily